MKGLIIGLLAVLTLFVLSARAGACDTTVVPAVAPVSAVYLPGYVLPVRGVVLEDGRFVARRPVVLAVRRVVRAPLVLTRRVARRGVVLVTRPVRRLRTGSCCGG